MKYLESRIKEVERRIKELTEELEILRYLASTISSSRQSVHPTSYSEEVKVAQQEKVRVIYAEEEIIANEVLSDGTVKIVLRGGIRLNDEVVANFLLKILEELKGKKDIGDYRLKESGGYITQIDLINPTPIALKQVEIALKYVWSKHSSS
ncbi:MAG: hypothetical protein RMH84_00605 [Sulfolobales archaeon]|nr:hypothetical protein [Sulfolobales archaeon]